MQPAKKTANRLINESSPYLLQHAHNPVDWYPWSDEAFEAAREADKPVLVSIGYSACHWCHVMEHESFEDEKIAAIMNEHFINIKVDMEERPDVDQIYMNFVQLTTGRGGWPMNVFLTPDKRPFFGGTYFPPASRYNMPSWPQILTSIADAYANRRDELETSANEIVGELRRLTIAETTAESLSTVLLGSAFTSYTRTFDSVNGGFGGAPKFPPAMSLEFLLRYHHRTGNDMALQMVRCTCDKMARGGIYDQIGGGFHRYAVDAIWLVPHFEKMLYDNAQLIRVYLHLYQVTRDEFYRGVAEESLEYILREMTDEKGGFYSTQDADSEGVEGKFFVWTPQEIIDVLGEEDAAVFNAYYDVTEHGNFEERNILNIKRDLTSVSADTGRSETEIREIIERSKPKLFAARESRIKPHRDEKILTAWNGLMLTAFADAAAVLGSGKYLEAARRNAEFILSELQQDGRILRTWKEGKAKLNGYIEDYANFADGLLRLFEVSGEFKYYREAQRLADRMISDFWDEENGGFYFTSHDHEHLIVRNKDYFDNATPSGNSVGADLFLRLARISGDDRYERFAVAILKAAAAKIRQYPQGFGRALSAIEFYLSDKKEIVIIGEKDNDLAKEVFERYLPNSVTIQYDPSSGDVIDLPLLSGRDTVDGKPAAYVCENYVCARPVTTKEDLSELL
jgi:uncharacterized protein